MADLTLPDVWSEFLSALISAKAKFLLIGAHAYAAHVEPRLTSDLDVLVEPTLANARRVRAAIVEFGFEAVAPTPSELAKPDKVWMLGRKPFRIDILTGIDGVSFDEAWASRVPLRTAAGELFVIGLDALLKNKRAAGRGKDLPDIEGLERVKAFRDGPGAKGPPASTSGPGKKAARKKSAPKKSAKRKAR